jgi:hypothetical protein
LLKAKKGSHLLLEKKQSQQNQFTELYIAVTTETAGKQVDDEDYVN